MSKQTRPSKTSTPSLQTDFTVENYGSVFFIRCHTERAKKFLVQSVEPDAQWFGDALAVEPRFIGGLLSSLREDGWRVR